jgi:hypothetical protein
MFNLKSICLALLISTILVAALPLEARQDSCTSLLGDQVYLIDDLFLRKYDGETISTMGFHVQGTAGSLDFDCTPYDIALNTPVTAFVEGALYACGINSMYFFTFYSDTNTLLFKYDENPK